MGEINKNYKLVDNKLILKDQSDFDPIDIFTCGQAFNWILEEDSSITAVAFSRLINLSKEGNHIIIEGTSEEDYLNIWYNYFDMARDYGYIKESLAKDDKIMEQAIEFGPGIRILNQDPFETLISFIISANNQIPRIKNSISLLSKHYGDFIASYRGRDYYSFPRPERLASVDPAEIRELTRVGFRDKRIVQVADMVARGDFNLDEIFQLDYKEAKERLMILPGVGPKVADCVLLFAYHKLEAFPVDVWVKRIMEALYLKEEKSNKFISQYAYDKFGDLAGYGQQYLFYYARELNLGK